MGGRAYATIVHQTNGRVKRRKVYKISEKENGGGGTNFSVAAEQKENGMPQCGIPIGKAWNQPITVYCMLLDLA